MLFENHFAGDTPLALLLVVESFYSRYVLTVACLLLVS